MQERQVTLGDTTYPLPEPFLILATENPIDQEGTIRFLEAQVDRFMLKLRVDYPSKEEELAILNANESTAPRYEVNPVITPETIFQARKLVDQVYVDEKLKGYIVDIIHATRDPGSYGLNLSNYIQFGASPRYYWSDTRCQSMGFSRRSRFCNSTGRQKHRYGCAPTSRHCQL